MVQTADAQVQEIRTLGGLLRTRRQDRPQAAAIVTDEIRLTYEELYERACRTAGAFSDVGVGRGDRVVYLGKNAVEYFDVIFGAALLGAAAVPVNSRLTGREAAAIVDDADAKVLVVGDGMGTLVDDVLSCLASSPVTRVVGGHADIADFRTWRDAAPAVDPGVEAGADDVCFQLYSSGTTGRPKGVMLSNANIFCSVLDDASAAAFDFSPSTVGLVAMPLFHIVGTWWSVATMFYGGVVVLLRDADPASIVRAIAEHRVTHAMLVPVVLKMMLDVPGIDDADFSSLELVMYGASPISEHVLTRSLSTMKCKFAQGYGLTETAGGVAVLHPEDHDVDGPNAHRLRAAGRANPNVELIVVDPTTGEVCGPDVVGEICVRTAQTMLGYWRQPEATAEALREDGWFRTGDAGYLDADGYVYIHDRIKDMIISGGENVYPAEVESVLMGHPGVADVAVIGVPSEKWGETPKAIVVPKEDATVTEAELIAYCRDNLAHFKCPTSVDWATTIPRNPSGKILKRELRAPYWQSVDRAVN